jgi:tetratricopeptide (TPR) repeat protein
MKKMKIFLTILLLSFCASVVRADVEQRREQLIRIIDEELKEVVRLNRQLGAKNPDLLLRMAELYLEKARLVNEKENKKWLTLSPEETSRMDQARFFSESRKYFKMAQKTCFFILKKFKRFKGRADVYYILAYNAKEFQDEKKAKTFFQRAVKYSKAGSYTAIKSKLALGEMYYNEKKYSKAIPLYEKALRKKDQKWWTKDAYNLAWCYFRVGNQNKAIRLMTEVHKLSGNSSYVDLSDQVERDLAYFYSESGRTREAHQFFKKIGKDVGLNFFKVGKYLKGQGKYAAAEKSFSEALKNANDNELKKDIYVELLSLYERFGKTKEHLDATKSLYEMHKRGELNPDQIESLKYHAGRMSAMLQKQVVSKTSRRRKNIKRMRAAYATQYFQILSGLSGKVDHKAIFHAAETQYAVNEFDKSAGLYDQAYELALSSGDTKIANLALDGLMASLNGKGVSKATTSKFMGKAYSIFLKKNPRSKESFKVYQRLFNERFSKGDIAGAERTLLEFKKYFPKSEKKQEVMLAKIIDHYREKNNRAAIAKWVEKINQGEFKVSAKVAKRLRLILLSIQFDKVENLNTKGQKVAALKGYLEIYKDAESSAEARKNAAYNISILFHELGNKDKTYDWAMRALSLMDSSDVLEYEDTYLLIASGLFNFREFRKSAEIYEISLEKICKKKSKNKETFYKNANIIYLAEKNLPKAVEVLELGKKCGIKRSTRQDANLDTLREIGEQERWQSFENLIKRLDNDRNYIPDLIYPLAQLRDTYLSRGRTDEANQANRKLMSFYRTARSRKQKIPLEALDVVAENYLIELRRAAGNLSDLKLSFPEAEYNKKLKRKFSLLDAVTTKSLEVFKVGSGHGIVEGYRILVESYRRLAQEISSFRPDKKSEEYVTSFQKSMREISRPIALKAKEFENEAKRQILSSKILSKSNFYFLGNSKLPLVPEFYPVKAGILMDRGGKQ